MVDQRLVEVCLLRQRQLQHDLLVMAERVELFQDLGEQDVFGFGLVGDGDRHFRLDNRHQAVAQDLAADVELLGNDGRDAFRIRGMDHRAHLGAEDAFRNGMLEQHVEFRHRLHHLNAVFLFGKALVDLQERHDATFLPEIFGGRNTVDVAVHGALEQDGTHDLVAIEGRRLDDAGPHVVDETEHLFVIAVGIFPDAIEAKRLRRGAAGLVEGRDEAGLLRCLFRHGFFCHLDYRHV